MGYVVADPETDPRATYAIDPGRVRALTARVVQHTNVPFNHVLVNRYRDGTDSIGLHADDEPELGRDPVVATLSLGVTRRFVLKPRRAGENQALDVGHGSLLVMGGTCQRHYVHGVPRQPGIGSERISLTFRRLLGPPGVAATPGERR